MKKLSSTERSPRELVTKGHTNVAIDLETLEDGFDDLSEDAIISYSLTFFPSFDLVLDQRPEMPTHVYLAESEDEEEQLLRECIKTLKDINATDRRIVGHNCGFGEDRLHIDKNGFDLPKLYARSRVHNIDVEYISDLGTYDTMDIGVGRYKHHHTDKSSGSTWIKLKELTRYFDINRPSEFDELGPEIQRLWNRDQFERVMLYNAADTMVEGLIGCIFHHQTEECVSDDKKISHNETCEHIQEGYYIGETDTWDRLISQTDYG